MVRTAAPRFSRKPGLVPRVNPHRVPVMPQIDPPARRRIPRLLAALIALVLGTAPSLPARADPYACQRYKAELAGLNDGGSTQRALRTEIGRLQAYYRTLNCEGGQFLFFDTRPPQCGAVEQRIKALNAGYGAENGEVVAARRRQLIAAVGLACADERPVDGQPVPQTARGGAQVICVRACDGAYFPMNNLPDGRGGADELCRALCPGAEAAAYSMPNGDDALRYAATIRGNRAYAALPNAFKFRKNFEPGCSCKPEGKTWAQSLAKAESMLFRQKGDIFVTPLQAERLSRPAKVRLTLVGRADRTAAELAADVAAKAEARTAPASTETSWTDPPGPQAAQASAQGPAQGSEPPAAAERPVVRVIAPAVIPVPARIGAP